MWKVLGSALVMASSTGIGWQVANTYRQRTQQLNALMQALRLLRMEVEYRLTPLPVALRQVAARAEKPVASLFSDASDALTTRSVTVSEAVDGALRVLSQRGSLLAADLEILQDFGKTLGTSDLRTQVSHLDVAVEALDFQMKESVEAQRKNVRLWQSLGVLFGLFLVIVL